MALFRNKMELLIDTINGNTENIDIFKKHN